MESQDQILASDKSVSENEGIELQVRISSDTSSSEKNDSGSVIEHLQEFKSTPDEVGCTLKNEKDSSPAETSNVIAEFTTESVQEECKNASVEKADSLCLSLESNNIAAEMKSEAVQDESTYVSVENSDLLSTELNNTPAYEEKPDAILVDFGDVPQEKFVAQVISATALTAREKFETTSNGSSFSTSHNDKDLSCTNILPSSDNLTGQSSDDGDVLKRTKKASDKCSPGTDGGVPQLESLKSLCVKQKDTDSIYEKSKTHDDRETISTDELQTSSRFSETAGNESATIKNSESDFETAALKNKNGTANATKNDKVMNEQLRKSTEIVCKEKTQAVCENSGTTTKNDASEIVNDKNLEQEKNITNELLSAKSDMGKTVSKETTGTRIPPETAVGATVSNETAGAGNPSETEPQFGAKEDGGEKKAFFYMSSSSVPGMGKEWEWPSVSSDSQYQRPSRRMERRRNISESRTCLGTQRCHYIILAVGILGAILGCLTYHLQDYGIGPKVLRPIGASAAFLSFVVCAFSSVYLTYLSYYTQGQSSRNYQPLDPVASMLIDTMPQGYNSDPRFYFTPSAAATFQQVFRETQSSDALDRRGYSWLQTDIKRPYDEPGPSGYDPDSKRFKMDPTTGEGESYEMKSMVKIGEKDRSKERNFSQASDGSHYTLADQADHPNSSGESENGEKTPLLRKK